MKKKTLWNIVLLLVLALQLVAEGYAAITMIRLNMLPDLYVLLLVGVLALLTLLVAGLMFLGHRKRVRVVRRWVACILAVLIAAGCLLVGQLATDAFRAVHTVTNHVTTTTRNMYVFVRYEDPAAYLADAKDYTFAYIENYDVKHTEKAKEYLEETLGQSIACVTGEDAKQVADKLLNKEVGALIMNGASVAILQENEGYETFSEKIRILETMPFSMLEEDKEPTEEKPTEPMIRRDVTNAPFAVYFSGSDTRSTMLTVSRSDVNILAVVNPVTKQVLLINTPRDYYVANPAGDGAMDKLTHCGLYGAECTMEVLSELYGVDVDYYGQINFTGFETLINAIGGITVYSDQSFKAGDTYISVGENHLNGSAALSFARERYRVSGGDNGRGKNQMKMVKAVIEKLTSGTTIISNYSSILGSLGGMFSTSMSMEDISLLVKMQLSDMAQWNIQSYAVTGVGGSERTYSAGTYAYVMHEDERSTAHAAELAQRVINGEILTEADMKISK